MPPSKKSDQGVNYGGEFRWEEAAEAVSNLVRLAELGAEFQIEEQRRQDLLKENPKGFQLDGVGYSCFICGGNTQPHDNWYDKWGIKCMTCQKAIDRKEIPASLAKNKESWYSSYELQDRFNIKGPTVTKWVRHGIIKARTVTRDGKGVHFRLFLVKDNKDFLPPKKLTESHGVSEFRDGHEWFWSEPWYQFFDPKEHLKGYGILEHIQLPLPKK